MTTAHLADFDKRSRCCLQLLITEFNLLKDGRHDVLIYFGLCTINTAPLLELLGSSSSLI